MKAALFDLDDTLFDHRHASTAALMAVRDLCEPLQHVPAPELQRAHAAVLEELHQDVLLGRLTVDEARIERFRRLFEAAGHVLAASESGEIARAYRDAYRQAWRPVPGACELLARVKREARVAIVSNNVRAEQLQKLEACSLDAHVDVVIVSGDEGVVKPDPAIFLRAVARLGCTPGQASMLGDSWPNDIVGARRAGLRAIWFNPRGEERPGPDEAAEIRALEPADEVLARLVHEP